MPRNIVRMKKNVPKEFKKAYEFYKKAADL